jgi:hypothetical protein
MQANNEFNFTPFALGYQTVSRRLTRCVTKAAWLGQILENDVSQRLRIAQAVCMSDLDQFAAEDSHQALVGD